MTILIENSHADGVCFDDLQGLTKAQQKLFIERGMVFCTEFKANDRRYAGNVIADTLKDACRLAVARGLGEIVIGTMVEQD